MVLVSRNHAMPFRQATNTLELAATSSTEYVSEYVAYAIISIHVSDNIESPYYYYVTQLHFATCLTRPD